MSTDDNMSLDRGGVDTAPGLSIAASDPDRSAHGLLERPLNPLRYDSKDDDPLEVAALLREKMPAGVRVLDIGCGTGAITLQVNRGKGNDIIGVEPDRARAEVAASRGITMHVGIADQSFFDSHGSFDVIVLSDVLEHLASPSDLLEMASRALVPGGKILASIPNVAHWSVRARLLFGRFNYTDIGIMDSTHLRWFTARTARELFERSGLSIVSMRWTAGTWMLEYLNPPFKFIPVALRTGLVRRLSQTFPLLFGCQHVIEAIRSSDTDRASIAEVRG